MDPIAQAETLISDFDAALQNLHDAVGDAARVCAEIAAQWKAAADAREKMKETTP